MSTQTLGLKAYRYASSALAPLVPLLLRQRMLRGKEDPARVSERVGKPSLPRPPGPLVWFHAVSVGECQAAMPLIHELERLPQHNILVTSGTVTSARLMAERLPEGVMHQFAPVDTPLAVRRFLTHWHPDVGIFIDSEIWPNLVLEAYAHGARLVLANARMSARSFEGWQKARQSAATLLACYQVCLAQDRMAADRLRLLGARNVQIIGSLKADSPPLPADKQHLHALQQAVGQRPILLAAQTHPGEDETILPVHDQLRRTYPELLTIIVPRHPERGDEIATLCGSRCIGRRSEGAMPTDDMAIYIADTIGELGLFYRIATFAFVGGSLIRHGGQNPLEPARLDCAVLAGPHTENFKDTYDAIFAAQGGGRVYSGLELLSQATHLLNNPTKARTMAENAARSANKLGGAVEKTIAVIETLLNDHAHT